MLPDPRPYFAELRDPRRETKNKLHPLSDILMIVFCAVLSGIEDWVGMEEFAEQKAAWFRGFLALPNGIPSHDTLSDVMGRLERQAFAAIFRRWVEAALPSLAGEQVCLDGKTLRGSREGEQTIHLMSAYAAKARLVLAQQAVADKSNEIRAIPDLLALLDLNGAVVSIDAMGCQKSIAHQIVTGGADYVLALKDNHPNLCDDVRLWLDTEAGVGRLTPYETVEKEHGRIERRRYVLSDRIDWLAQKPEWAGLAAVGRVESTRVIGEQTTTECRYYLCSFTDLSRFAEAVRGHWGIENGQHWVLDVQFGEDANRARKDHSAENLALVRRMALNVIRRNGPSKDSLRRRKLRASLNDDYRARLIFGPQTT
jgi:predicted transposase YbfD/YdcC